MANERRADPYWDLKQDIAKEIAGKPNPTVMKYCQAFEEEFGTLPPPELIDYFKNLLPADSDAEDEGDAVTKFIRKAVREYPSVLKFRQAFIRHFGGKPSSDQVAQFIKNLSQAQSSAKSAQGGRVQSLIDHLVAQQNVTILQFRQAFENQLGFLPKSEHIEQFIKRLPPTGGGSAPGSPPRKETQSAETIGQSIIPLTEPSGETAPTVPLLNCLAKTAIVLTDPQGVIKIFNHAAEKLLGYRADELLGRHTPLSFLDEQEFEAYASHFQQDLSTPADRFAVLAAKAAGRNAFEKEWHLVTKDGRLLTASLTISRVLDSAGTGTGYLIEINETSALNTLHCKMKALFEENAANVQIRENLLISLSRQILAPLTAIKGFSELLTEEELAPELSGYVTKIAESADAVTHILSDRLYIHRVQEGDLALMPGEFDPRIMGPAVVSAVLPRIGSRAPAPALHMGDSLPERLVGDESRIRQILVALLSHGVSLEGATKVDLALHLEKRQDRRGKLVAQVGVQGGRMPPEALETVFNMSDCRQFFSSGGEDAADLSLAICRYIARMMQGDVTLDSLAGGGVQYCFTAWLETVSPDRSPPVKTLRILLAENDPVVFSLLNLFLDDGGHQLTWTKSGREVVECYLAAPGAFDIIFMDIGMPEKNGREATQEIRAAGHTEIPIIAVTAYNNPGDRERCLAAGMNDYITKPFDKAILNKLVAKWQQAAIDHQELQKTGDTVDPLD